MRDPRRDPRLNPQAGDRLRVAGVIVEVVRCTHGQCPAVTYFVGGFLPSLLLDEWCAMTADATVVYAGGSDA